MTNTGWVRSCVLIVLLALVAPQTFADDGRARGVARQSPEWLRDAVVYEIFPRAFSKEGGFRGIIPQLDRLKALGVNVIWLMPIHPVGRLKAKGTLGSPYAVRDTTPSTRSTASRTISSDSWPRRISAA